MWLIVFFCANLHHFSDTTHFFLVTQCIPLATHFARANKWEC